jgi:hypothetical protein
MASHKFDVGQVVRSQQRPDGVIPPGNYEIVRHLPSRDAERDVQYRVKSVLDGHERIVRESDLA